MNFFRSFVVVLLALTLEARAEVMTLDLPGGMRIQGEVVSWDGATLGFQTSGGLLSYRRDQLSAQALEQLEAKVPKADVAALKERVVRLESEIQSLRRENESLKRQLLVVVKGEGAQIANRVVADPVVPKVASKPQQIAVQPVETPASAEGYTISSTGKRHNARCRYYGKGRACGPSEGTACKVCGG